MNKPGCNNLTLIMATYLKKYRGIYREIFEIKIE
jgi:hypothetical protein